jgi:hypothetical protein
MAMNERRANRFVSVLCALAQFVHARPAVELCAERAVDVLAGGVFCGVRDARRVGPHVGDETLGAVTAAEIDAFVQGLRELHGLANAELEFARRFLLQSRSGERRGGIPALLALFDRGDFKRPGGHRGDDVECLRLVRDLGFAAVDRVDLGRKDDRATVRSELGGDRPVLARNEGSDLAFAIDDQPDGNRLNAAGRQAAAHLGPQQR